MIHNVKFKRLTPHAAIPTRGSYYAAGYDLYAACEYDVEIPPHTTKMIGTGLCIQPPAGYFGAIFARSGLATKQGLRPANCVGVCDEDYIGEYIVALHNDSEETRTIHTGDRIAQLVFMEYQDVEFEEVRSLGVTDRGAGGFGSTGK